MLRKQAMNILAFNLRDNVNSYTMQEDGSYHIKEQNGEPLFNMHKEFYTVSKEVILETKLF